MSKIVISEYTQDKRSEWDRFVLDSNNGTIFHLQDFLDYHTKGRFNFNHLMFHKDNELIAVLPGGYTGDGSIYWSPIGASYGSFVTKDIHFDSALEIIDAFMLFCKDKNLSDVYLIPPPIIYSQKISQHIEYAMLYRKFDFELHYISHSIDIKNYNDILSVCDKTARKTIHKILREKKLSIRESDDFVNFNRILIENKSRHNVKPTHSLEDMLRLKELLPDNIKLQMVYYEEKPIAGSLLFICNSKVILCFYNMLLYEYEYLKPIYLIMYETMRWSKENGFDWVDIGVSQDTSAEDPMTPQYGLIAFKERFNARGILRSTYHYKFR